MAVRIEIRRANKRIRPGIGTWIRSSSVSKIQGPPDPRELASLTDHRGAILGWGLYSPESDIPLRMISIGETHPPETWLADRLCAALDARDAWLPADTDGYREVNSEGDGLPGLVIDRYGADRIVQITTAPMAAREPEILAWLAARGVDRAFVLRPERAAAREGFAPGIEPPAPRRLRHREYGVLLTAPGPPGQKTGAYHDQRENRRRFAHLAAAAGGPMLDLGCHVGGFSLHAAARGVRCIAVDRSQTALQLVAENARVNHLAGIETAQADMFAPLAEGPLQGPFGSVVFDPPKIAQSERDLPRARTALGHGARQLLPRIAVGGFFALCSCSHHLGGASLDEVVDKAVREGTDAGHWTRIARWGPGPDHPVAPAHAEGDYLRVHVYQRRA